jgi:hypothetical protein
VTLLVITSAGFGRRASWQDESKPPPGHTMGFGAAVESTIKHLLTKALAPEWLYALSARVELPLIGPALTETRKSFEAVKMHMMDLISLSRAWVVGGKASNMDAALLRNLVEANMMQAEDDGHNSKMLTDAELESDVFVRFLSWAPSVIFETFSADLHSRWPRSVKDACSVPLS